MGYLERDTKRNEPCSPCSFISVHSRLMKFRPASRRQNLYDRKLRCSFRITAALAVRYYWFRIVAGGSPGYVATLEPLVYFVFDRITMGERRKGIFKPICWLTLGLKTIGRYILVKNATSRCSDYYLCDEWR